MRNQHCETCTCGLTEVSWSDRGGWVDLKDPESVAEIVLNCSLDHYYDRTSNGIPYGLEEFQERLSPIVAKHLSLAEPDWENKTVYLETEQIAALKTDFLAALR